MTERKREKVSRVFANMGRALAACQKTLPLNESRLDRYIGNVVSRNAQADGLLSTTEKNGLRIFLGKGQCITCHDGPLLTDQHFHNTGLAPRIPGQPDPGRRAGSTKVRGDEFNCLGRFSDARPEQCEELDFLGRDDPAMALAFKTPGLRNVSLRSLYACRPDGVAGRCGAALLAGAGRPPAGRAQAGQILAERDAGPDRVPRHAVGDW